MLKTLSGLILIAMIAGCNTSSMTMKPINSIKIATFNVSMDATNYVGRNPQLTNNTVLVKQLKQGSQQIKNVAEIIQRVRPDIILLNEFDYIDDPKQGIELFIKQYLNVAQSSQYASIDYPYYYYASVNTGKSTPYDLTGDGKATGNQGDAWGFGFFEGQYAMVLLSRYPINTQDIRTFQNFKWKDMPGALRPIDPKTGKYFYNDEIWKQYPLSSKSHWDVPVNVNGETIHVLASHPTPPVFDGPENRNGRKNHDEVRFWLDYITPEQSDYIYDDNSQRGGIEHNTRFVILGDQNSSSTEGASMKEAIGALLASSLVNDKKIPASIGGDKHNAKSPLSKHHTAYWGMRADYVLPSSFGLEVINNGVFWPQKSTPEYRLIKDREASSDHRLVWSELTIK